MMLSFLNLKTPPGAPFKDHHHLLGALSFVCFSFGGRMFLVFRFIFFKFTSGGLAGAVVEYKFICLWSSSEFVLVGDLM